MSGKNDPKAMNLADGNKRTGRTKGSAPRKGIQEYDDRLNALPPAPGQRQATQVIPRPSQAPGRTGSDGPSVASGSSARYTGSSPGASRVGAVAMRGIDVDNIPGGDDSTVVIGGETNSTRTMSGSGGTVVAEAVTTEDHIVQELRDQLRSEIQRELRNQIVTAEVVASGDGTGTNVSSLQPSGSAAAAVPSSNDETKSKKRNRCLVAALIALLLAIAGGAVGALFGTGVIGGGSDTQQQNVAGGTVGNGQGEPTSTPTAAPSPAPPPPGYPTQSPTQKPPTQPPTQRPSLRPTSKPTTNMLQLSSPQTLKGQNNDDNFGDFVVISRDGSTMAVGATDGNYVQVFRRDGTWWRQIGSTLRGTGGGDQFGRSLDLNKDGSMLVVGAWNNDDAAEKAGHARVYAFDGSAWTQVGQTLTGTSALDRFGWYVSMADDGNTIAASARLGDPRGVQDAGYVRVFTFDGSAWSQLGSGDLEGQFENDQFGRSLALDATGRRIAVGAVKGGGGRGRVQVFDYTAEGWMTVGEELDGPKDEDWQGTAVALSEDGQFLAIAADGDDTNGSNSGMVRVYRLEGCCTWVQHGIMFGESSDDQFGAGHISISSDGGCVAVGANHFGSDRGKGYLYKWKDSNYEKVAEANGNSSNDRFGDSATVSGDCQWVAWGAYESDGNGPGYVDVFQVG